MYQIKFWKFLFISKHINKIQKFWTICNFSYCRFFNRRRQRNFINFWFYVWHYIFTFISSFYLYYSIWDSNWRRRSYLFYSIYIFYLFLYFICNQSINIHRTNSLINSSYWDISNIYLWTWFFWNHIKAKNTSNYEKYQNKNRNSKILCPKSKKSWF